MTRNSNFAAQAFSFALALVLSVGAFGVTVAPDQSTGSIAPAAEMVA